MDFLDLFIASLIPVLELLIITAVGTLLALERFDVLGENSRKHLNAVVVYVFYPALVSSNLAKTITLESMKMLWFMPINILLTFIIGTALGWLLIKITRAPHDLQGLTLGCCAAGNLGNMLLVIIPSICKERSDPFGPVDSCYTRGMAYASLSMAMGAIYFWSYVYNIVRIYSCKSIDDHRLDSSTVNKASAAENDLETVSKDSIRPLVPSEGILKSNDTVNQLALECPMFEENEKVTAKEKLKSCLWRLAENLNLGVLFSPSTVGAIVGMVIGMVPPLRKSLIGDSAPLRVLQDSASLLGDASIPVITLLVGANLLGGLRGSGVRRSILVGIIFVRYIALPVIGVGIVKGAIRFNLIPQDPLYQFVLLLQFALPPAVNIGTITQLFGVGESECSVIMLATYVCAAMALTLWSMCFLWLVS